MNLGGVDIDLTLHTVSWTEAIFRVLLALSFGFLIGYDRGSKDKPVDYRVYMIVAKTTCLLALMGEELAHHYALSDENLNIGLMRIVQGVLTGIGFLGAGAIIKSSEKEKVIGTTTGASVWSAGSMGLMLGFGLYGLAIIGFAVLVTLLILFGMFKKPLFDKPDDRRKD